MAITSAPYNYAGLFHALRATGTARPVPRGLPPLFAPPGTASTPWLFWFLGGGAPRGAPLPPRTLDRALRPRPESRDVEHRARWRVPDLVLAPAPALRRCELEGGGPVATVCLWPRPRLAALSRAQRGTRSPHPLAVVALGGAAARGAGHTPGVGPAHGSGGRPCPEPGLIGPPPPLRARHHSRPAAAPAVWPLAGAVHGDLNRPRPWGGPDRRVPGRAGAPGRGAEYRHLWGYRLRQDHAGRAAAPGPTPRPGHRGPPSSTSRGTFSRPCSRLRGPWVAG